MEPQHPHILKPLQTSLKPTILLPETVPIWKFPSIRGPLYRPQKFNNPFSGDPKMVPRILANLIRVVVKIVVPFWIPMIIRHLIFRVPKKGL